MKKYLSTILLIFLIWACKPQKEVQSTAQEEKKVVIPEDMVVSPDIGPAVRDVQIQWFEKGKALYKIHCDDCHGIFTKGKDGVPNFTKTQIDNYKSSALANPEEHAAIKKMSMEQFNYVITYLRLRKLS